VDILNSALLDLDENNCTENLEEITDGNYDEIVRNDNGLLLAEVGDMSDGTNVDDDDEEKNWEGLHIAFQ
jgi:hypothetical protein